MTSNNTTALLKQECPFDLSINALIYANNAAAVAFHVPLAIFAVVSNAVVIITVIKNTSLHRPPNILISNLAFSDLLVGAVAEPLLIILHLIHNADVTCSVYSKVYSIYSRAVPLIVCSSFVQVCVMCWDRSKAVSNPMNYRTTVTNKKTMKVVVTVWLAWVTFVTLREVIPRGPVRTLLAISALASFIIICVVSQVATLKAMRRQNNQIAAATNIDTFAREKKLAITLRFVLGSLILSVFPQLVFNFSHLVTATNQLRGQVFTSPWVKLAMCLSSSLNPVIYFWRHESMRSAALRFIGR